MTKRIPKLIMANDSLFSPKMIWNYVVITERINKLGKFDMHCSPCVTEQDVKEDIDNFLKWAVINPDAVRGVHYNYAVFSRSPTQYEGVIPPVEVTSNELVNKMLKDTSVAFQKIADS